MAHISQATLRHGFVFLFGVEWIQHFHFLKQNDQNFYPSHRWDWLTLKGRSCQMENIQPSIGTGTKLLDFYFLFFSFWFLQYFTFSAGIWSSGWWCGMVTTVGFTFRPPSTWPTRRSSHLKCSLKSQLRSKKTGQPSTLQKNAKTLCIWNFEITVDNHSCFQVPNLDIWVTWRPFGWKRAPPVLERLPHGPWGRPEYFQVLNI